MAALCVPIFHELLLLLERQNILKDTAPKPPQFSHNRLFFTCFLFSKGGQRFEHSNFYRTNMVCFLVKDEFLFLFPLSIIFFFVNCRDFHAAFVVDCIFLDKRYQIIRRWKIFLRKLI